MGIYELVAKQAATGNISWTDIYLASKWIFAAIILISIIQIILMALVLWRTARNKKKAWFIFFLLVHTIIIEAIYLILTRTKNEKAARKRKRR